MRWAGILRSWFSTPFSPVRRGLVAACALLIAAVLLRVPIAEALVVRGDGNLYRSDLPAAMAHYRRALFFDGESVNAADRLLFVAAMRHRPAEIVLALHDTQAIMARHSNARLLSDRALCFLVLRRYDAAYSDFAAAAKIDRSANTLTFAGFAARRMNRIAEARHFWQLAAIARGGGR